MFVFGDPLGGTEIRIMVSGPNHGGPGGWWIWGDPLKECPVFYQFHYTFHIPFTSLSFHYERDGGRWGGRGDPLEGSPDGEPWRMGGVGFLGGGKSCPDWQHGDRLRVVVWRVPLPPISFILEQGHIWLLLLFPLFILPWLWLIDWRLFPVIILPSWLWLLVWILFQVFFLPWLLFPVFFLPWIWLFPVFIAPLDVASLPSLHLACLWHLLPVFILP